MTTGSCTAGNSKEHVQFEACTHYLTYLHTTTMHGQVDGMNIYPLETHPKMARTGIPKCNTCTLPFETASVEGGERIRQYDCGKVGATCKCTHVDGVEQRWQHDRDQTTAPKEGVSSNRQQFATNPHVDGCEASAP
jgi:hypothetical protein